MAKGFAFLAVEDPTVRLSDKKPDALAHTQSPTGYLVFSWRSSSRLPASTLFSPMGQA